MHLIDIEHLESAKIPTGKPEHNLPFDPVVLRDSFFKMQAALAVYNHGTNVFTSNKSGEYRIRPAASDADVYAPFIESLANRFAAAFIRGESIVVGAIGDSTLAGADNCYYDNWLSTLERQLKPFFAAGMVDFTTRNVGHNGGFKSLGQVSCVKGLLGDVDIAFAYYPFVRPGERGSSPAMAYELFIRRALSSGVLPHVMDYDAALFQEYGQFGTGFGCGFSVASDTVWYPPLGRAHWGRVGDGLCHVAKTRSGSAAVMHRNWVSCF
jgi:hypothetical protein